MEWFFTLGNSGNVLENLTDQLPLASSRASTRVRSEDDIVQFPKGVICGKWLLNKNVEPGPRKGAGFFVSECFASACTMAIKNLR